eukprot:TRINITY_DN648_c0_g2_i3.p1 TRINITY_DN648_c0_g2~~TRINITY_DN648_c0_g2_i3.p1  ORF type:complete len:169 (-),score=1.01 TRINITY_DN648_c0_g2_i3:452-958(-)
MFALRPWIYSKRGRRLSTKATSSTQRVLPVGELLAMSVLRSVRYSMLLALDFITNNVKANMCLGVVQIYNRKLEFSAQSNSTDCFTSSVTIDTHEASQTKVIQTNLYMLLSANAGITEYPSTRLSCLRKALKQRCVRHALNASICCMGQSTFGCNLKGLLVRGVTGFQ